LKSLDVATIVVGAALLAAVLLGSRFAGGDYGDALTRNTIRLSLSWFTAALFLMIGMSPADWSAATLRGRVGRWCWTWALIAYLVHLAMAFHYFHHWSHAHAFEHTRQASGLGEGIFFSYFFSLLWSADTSWWWLRPSKYAARRAWLHRSIYAFLLFIVFNGAVVFALGPVRWAGAAATAALAVAWFVSLRRARSNLQA
jgi:hypothetical protein